MSKYGPTRSELKFRLGFSAVGLVLMAVALARYRAAVAPASNTTGA